MNTKTKVPHLSITKAKCVLLLTLTSLLPLSAQLNLSNQRHEVESLSGLTASLSGESELHVTGSGTPLSGSSIALSSTDSWVFFHQHKPSAIANLLSQIQINGQAAELNSNVRVAQYGQGAVVIPHPADFQPMTIFDGENFSGSSMSLDTYTAYGSSQLGMMASRTSSFILKRGYTATFAENTDGTGRSRNYVAADGDLKIGALPSSLDNQINFVRIFPWRWTAKKGTCDASPDLLDADWHYNWDINRSSTLDWEYAGIRQSRWWPSLNQNWESRGINHLSGYNEPANPVEDAYTSINNGQVSVGVAAWTDLLATGLRVGAPAVTDGGRPWLYSFVSEADSQGKRIDYVPIHFYWSYRNNDDPAGAANQMYQFLKEVHDRLQRPIWVTEFNNGANWTGNAPSTGQNRDVIQAMIQMMDDTPWIERYAIYGNVEWTRDVHYDNGGLTPMGQMYRDHEAPIGYVQALKSNRTQVASYDFDNNSHDISGCGNHILPVGIPQFSSGKHGQAIELGDDCEYLQLPGDIASSDSFSFAAWVHWDGGSGGQRIFDFGNYDLSQYMVLSPNQNGGLSFGLRNGGGTSWITHPSPLPSNSWQHVAVTKSGGTTRLYLNGTQVASGNLSPGTLRGTQYNYLGKSQWPNDPLFSGKLDDVHLANYALSAADITAMMENTMAMEVSSEMVVAPAANQLVPYSGTISGTVTDPDAQEISYTKIYGPSWLNIASDGTLSGTPDYDDEGEQLFTVRALDGEGERQYFMLSIDLPIVLGDGTWTFDQDGLWSDSTKWSGNIPANGAGFEADFSTLNITADRTVTLETAREIGVLKFGDTIGNQSWTIEADGGTLTLDSGSEARPTIHVANSSARIEPSLSGDNGVSKSGAGTLILGGASSLAGTLDLDEGLSSGDGGNVRAAYSSALSNLDTIRIRNNNNSSSTLELDGSAAGSIISPARIELSGRHSDVPAVRNLGGENGLFGGIAITLGGSNYLLQADAGTLELGGAINSLAGGTRRLTFQGQGDSRVSGVIANGAAETLNLSKTGSGRLFLESRNTYTGSTEITEGELVVNGTTGEASTTLASGSVLSGDGTISGDLLATNGATVVVGQRGFSSGPDTPFSLVDDFENYLLGSIGGSPNTTGDLWSGVFNGTANARIVSSGGNQAIGVNGIPSQPGSGWRGAITSLSDAWSTDFSLADGETATYFLRVRSEDVDATDFIFGFSDQPASSAVAPGNDLASPWNEYAVTLSIRDGNLRANAGSSGHTIITPVTDETWLNVWVVINQNAKTYQVATSEGLADGNLFAQTFAYGRRSAAVVENRALVTFGLHESLDVSGRIDDLYFAQGVSLSNPLQVSELIPKGSVLTVGDEFILPAGATLELDVSTSTLHDKLLVEGTFQALGTLKVTFDSSQAPPRFGAQFDLFDAAGGNISFSSLDLPALPNGLVWDASEIENGVLTVVGLEGGYWDWARNLAFDSGTDLPLNDANGDGWANVFSWLFGNDPLQANAPVGLIGEMLSVEPTAFPGANPEELYFSLTAVVRKNTPGWNVHAEAATSLTLLDDSQSTQNLISRQLEDLGDFERRQWIWTEAIGENSTGFLRLKMVED